MLSPDRPGPFKVRVWRIRPEQSARRISIAHMLSGLVVSTRRQQLQFDVRLTACGQRLRPLAAVHAALIGSFVNTPNWE